MQLEPEEVQENPAVEAFIAELRHWREVAGYSQEALARLVGYTPSYVSKVERGTVLASRSFAESADQHLRAGRALIRRWNPGRASTPEAECPRSSSITTTRATVQPSATARSTSPYCSRVDS